MAAIEDGAFVVLVVTNKGFGVLGIVEVATATGVVIAIGRCCVTATDVVVVVIVGSCVTTVGVVVVTFVGSRTGFAVDEGMISFAVSECDSEVFLAGSVFRNDK